MNIRVLIVDDHEIVREGLQTLLSEEPDFEIVGMTGDGAAAVTLAEVKKPDVIVMDLVMPGLDGIEATRRIKQLVPEARILILTVHEDKSLMQEAIHSGAMGYILKRAVKSELINAIQAVLRGELYLHPAMARLLFLEQPVTSPQTVKFAPEALTGREIEVLRLIAQGYTNSQAAEILCISVRTVEYHRSNLTAKLNIHSRVELIRYAEENGLI